MPNEQNSKKLPLLLRSQLVKTNQTQKESLFHIDFKSYFLGSLDRTGLSSLFNIKKAAALRDLFLYKDLATKNIKLDQTRSRFADFEFNDIEAPQLISIWSIIRAGAEL